MYEDALVQVRLPDQPVTVGHVEVHIPSKQLLNDLEEDEITHAFYVASFCATGLFESLNVQGTNIILTEEQNQDLVIHVLARMPDDGLSVLWNPLEMPPAELESLAKSVADDIDIRIWKKNNPTDEKPQETKVENLSSENELVRHLRRRHP